MNSVRAGQRTVARLFFILSFSLFFGVSQVQAQPSDDEDTGTEKPYGWGAQPSDTKQKLSCLVANDFYIVHFTSYLEPVAGQTQDPKKIFKQ
jgi:hypothetical protein